MNFGFVCLSSGPGLPENIVLQKAPESLLSDPKIAKTMLNDWDSAMIGHTSKVVFSNKLEEEIYRSSKTKGKSKDVFKGIASSK